MREPLRGRKQSESWSNASQRHGGRGAQTQWGLDERSATYRFVWSENRACARSCWTYCWTKCWTLFPAKIRISPYVSVSSWLGLRKFRGDGAGEGNRTLVFSLEGCCSTIELHPRAADQLSRRASGLNRHERICPLQTVEQAVFVPSLFFAPGGALNTS